MDVARDGNPQVNIRLPEDVLSAFKRLAETEGGYAALIETTTQAADLTAETRRLSGETYRQWLLGWADAEHEPPQLEGDQGYEADQQAAQEREQESARLLADAEARLQSAKAQTAALEERARRFAPAVQAADVLLRAGWKSADLAPALHALALARLNPDALAAELQRFGGINKAVTAWGQHVKALQADATRLQGEVAALTEQKAGLLGAVRDTVQDVADTVADEVRQSLASIGQTAGQMRAANGHANVQLAKAARFLRDQRARLADRDKLASEALASLVRTVGPVALAAQLLALYIADAGDPELPRALAESMPYSPRLSWAEGKLRSLAAQVAPQVIAASEAPGASERRDGV